MYLQSLNVATLRLLRLLVPLRVLPNFCATIILHLILGLRHLFEKVEDSKTHGLKRGHGLSPPP